LDPAAACVFTMPKDARDHQGLRAIVQSRLMNDVLQNSCDKWPGWMVLIVDPPALRVLSSAIGMYDLMERRVTLVEDLTKKRAPFRDMGAIYFLTPTKQSIDRLIRDWTPSATQKEPLYGNAIFLYFLGRLPDPLLDMIKGCKPLVKRVKALGEVNVDFLVKEDRVFHLDMKKSFRYLFPHRNAGQPQPVEMVICDKLVTLCATLNEYPHIRYHATSPLSKSIASVFHRKMTDFVGGNEKWWYHGDGNHPSRGRSTLLLFDRADDCLSPLMHDFTYQAMVNDLLPIEEDKITYKSETIGTGEAAEGKETKDKDVLLNEKDQVWVELRGKHIADVIQTLSSRIREMVNSSTSKVAKNKGDDAKALSLSQMASALKALPEYREVMDKLSQHMHLSHQCMEIFNKKGLLELAEVEQTLATGKTEEGRVPKLNELVDMVEEQLQSVQDSQVRLRLLAIYILSQNGVRPSDQDRLFAAARLSPQEQKVLSNLEKMGCPLIQEPDQKGKKGFCFHVSGPNGCTKRSRGERFGILLRPLRLRLEGYHAGNGGGQAQHGRLSQRLAHAGRGRQQRHGGECPESRPGRERAQGRRGDIAMGEAGDKAQAEEQFCGGEENSVCGRRDVLLGDSGHSRHDRVGGD